AASATCGVAVAAAVAVVVGEPGGGDDRVGEGCAVGEGRTIGNGVAVEVCGVAQLPSASAISSVPMMARAAPRPRRDDIGFWCGIGPPGDPARSLWRHGPGVFSNAPTSWG